MLVAAGGMVASFMINEAVPASPPDFKGLPDITLRQLEVFRTVCHERSFANAALELRSTRANIKRVCVEFEKAVGRPLFDDPRSKILHPTAFAEGLLGQVVPLSRALRRLSENVRAQHQAGRILRFAAAGEFFRGGLFTHYLSRLKINDVFRPCFLRIETKRYRTALLNAECDVYFGVGLVEADRLDLIDLGPVTWEITRFGRPASSIPTSCKDLAKIPWWISGIGDTEPARAVLEAFHQAGAGRGGLLEEDEHPPTGKEGYIFHPNTTGLAADGDATWPQLRFTAVLRKHHPYPDLKTRLSNSVL